MGQNRHLSNIFAKLGISLRSQLDRVLPGERAASRRPIPRPGVPGRPAS
jgi:hypothetical protein